jgi:hypothetical protein
MLRILLPLFFLMTNLWANSDELTKRFISPEDLQFVKTATLKKLETPLSERDAQLFVNFDEVCGEVLSPLTSDQKNKTYHLEFTVIFKRTIPGDSKYCEVKQRGGKERCLLPKRFKAKLLSDTYEDECAQKLRGFAWITYTIPGENMMDSVSPGRTLEVAQRFNGAALYRPGPAYNVAIERFEFFETYRAN